jgi:hypothetical protein
MTTQEAHLSVASSQNPGTFQSRWAALDKQGALRFKADETSLEFCFRAGNTLDAEAVLALPAPNLDSMTQAVLDPSLKRAIVRIAPYPNMACGD